MFQVIFFPLGSVKSFPWISFVAHFTNANASYLMSLSIDFIFLLSCSSWKSKSLKRALKSSVCFCTSLSVKFSNFDSNDLMLSTSFQNLFIFPLSTSGSRLFTIFCIKLFLLFSKLIYFSNLYPKKFDFSVIYHTIFNKNLFYYFGRYEEDTYIVTHYYTFSFLFW